MQQLCELLVNSSTFIEAAFVLSADTTYVWHGKKALHPGDMLHLAHSIISTADELHLFNSVPGATITMDTSFGALYFTALDMEHVLILCLLEGYSLHVVSELLTSVHKTSPSQGVNR